MNYISMCLICQECNADVPIDCYLMRKINKCKLKEINNETTHLPTTNRKAN